MPAADGRTALQFPTAERRQAIAPEPFRCRNTFSRIRTCAALDCDRSRVWALCWNECPTRFRRSPFANAAKLGLEQKGARYFCSRLSRSIEKNSRGKNRENEGSETGDGRRYLSTAVCLCRSR